VLPKFVPAAVLGWLAEGGTLLQELADYSCGKRRDGVLPELVGAGDRESVRRNLLIGPRQRFATARTAAADRTLDGGVTPHTDRRRLAAAQS